MRKRNSAEQEKCQTFFLSQTNRQFNNTLRQSEIRRSFCIAVSADSAPAGVSPYTQRRGAVYSTLISFSV